MKLMRFKWKYLLASLLLANIIACSNDDLAQMSNRQEQDSGARTAELFTQNITLETAGTLEDKLIEAMGETDVTTLEKLVVSGPFTAADMQYVRDSLTGLVAIDMKDAVIKASDEAYYYRSNNWESYFQDNQLATGMFYNMDNLKEVVLPSTITKIGSDAFESCSNLMLVTIPESVTNIGDNAFDFCEVLSNVVLPDALEIIGRYAFGNCDSLKTIVIPNNVTEIGDRAFQSCHSLSSVTLPDGLKSIKERTFHQCYALEAITLPANLETIEADAFSSCDSLKTIIIPDKITSIERYTFYGCKSLSSVTLPSGLKSINEWAFQGCSVLESIVLPNSLESLGNGAFAGCSKLSSIVIPEGVKDISNYCFEYCRSLAEITISEGVERIGSYSFQDCDSIKTVNLPSTLKTLSDWSFKNCNSLQELIVPENVTNVGGHFISECPSLRAVIWNPTIDVPGCYNINCFLFVKTDQIAVNNIEAWKAVVINGVSESTVNLSVSWNEDYKNVYEFKAKKQIYTRHFGDETIPGGSSGWKTIVLPFTPDSIYHETKGQIAPFNSNIKGAKPFWLRELTSEGFKDVTKIEANKPYIIAMPNHNDYLEEYRLNGNITFVARDSLVRVTPDVMDASIGSEYELHPTYQYIEQSENIYTLGTIWNYYEEENVHYSKSFFKKNDSYVSAFNAYVTPLGGGRSSRSVFDLDTRSKETRAAWQPNTTGIPQIGDM